MVDRDHSATSPDLVHQIIDTRRDRRCCIHAFHINKIGNSLCNDSAQEIFSISGCRDRTRLAVGIDAGSKYW